MRVIFGSTEGRPIDQSPARAAEAPHRLPQRLLTPDAARHARARAGCRATRASGQRSRPWRRRCWRRCADAARAPGRPEREDIVSMLEQALRRDGSPMTEQELRDELITLLSDGPTATSLSWAFERLLRHPDKLARLREEVLAGARGRRLPGRGGERDPAPRARRCRWSCAAWSSRCASAATRSRRARRSRPCIYLVHHREDVYPHPFSFMPERFLGAAAGELHVDPVRQRRAPLRGGGFRAAGDEAGDADGARGGGAGAGARRQPRQRATRSSVAFAPGDQAPVIVTRRRRPERPTRRRSPRREHGCRG